MFTNLYKYNFKMLLRDKSTVFWTVFWSMILATFYFLCFSNLLDGETFEKIDIAIVESKSISEDFYTAIDESNMFVVKKTDENEAKELLSTGKVKAYLRYNNELELIVNKSGMDESIVKIFTDTYSQNCNTIKNLITYNPNILTNGFLSDLSFNNSYIDDINIGNTTNVIVIFYYSLIAMTCLLSSTLGSQVVTRIQANQSCVAARINIAPTHKFKSFLASMCASMTFHMISILLTLIYLIYFLKIEFGNSMGYILLICLAGSFTGFAFGAFVSAVVVKNEAVKITINLTCTLFGCFLSGLMAVDIKYIVQSKLPIVAYINPANLITDGLYALYYYTTLDRYFTNVIILFLLGVIFSILTYLVLRRQKYANI